VYTPDRVYDQLQAATQEYLQAHVKIDLIRRQVTLPKLLDWYKADFAATKYGGC